MRECEKCGKKVENLRLGLYCEDCFWIEYRKEAEKSEETVKKGGDVKWI